MKQRRFLLFLHLFFSSIMLGGAVLFVVMSIRAAVTDDEQVLKACYTVMHILATTSVRASTIGATVTGILLSVLTHWGLFRFYWIIAKEVLTLVTIGIGIVGMYFWTLGAFSVTAAEGMAALHSPVFIANIQQLYAGIALQVASLVAIFLLSVFKPWGQRKQKIVHNTYMT
ncbi:hypothetical protein [Brevibacillus sp. B_LB10_24]|uniref:hypothetical protein n=1 Tax=Brevibacillus sp. B_LB10_24 TaxID=3380645 RepID=UPI0038BC2EA6